jgi:restriction endonuclease HindI-like protein
MIGWPTALDQDEAVAVMLEKYEVCTGLFHGFDWSKWTAGAPQERLGLLPPAQEHILKASEGVIDIFAAAGLAKPDISILSEEFLIEVRAMPQRNLAVELLQKLPRCCPGSGQPHEE